MSRRPSLAPTSPPTFGAWAARPGAVAIRVRLTPKAARDSLEGVGLAPDGRPALLARVRAPPQDGEANLALVRTLAKALRRPASSIRVESGAASRLKTIVVDGEPDEIAAALAALFAPPEGKA